MSDSGSSRIWKRRAILMALVALVVAVPLTIVLRGDDETEREPKASRNAPGTPRLGPSEFDRDLAVELRLPRSWTEKRREGVLLLASEDRRARVAISAPGPEEDADQLHEEVLDQFAGTYKRFEEIGGDRKSKLGGLRARTTAARALGKESKQELGVIVATAEGRKKAYLVVAYTPAEDPGLPAVEAQAVLNALKLRG